MAEVATDSTTKEWLTVAEIAASMKVSKMTVYRLVDSGELQCVHFGRSRRVDRAAFEAYIAERTTGG